MLNIKPPELFFKNFEKYFDTSNGPKLFTLNDSIIFSEDILSKSLSMNNTPALLIIIFNLSVSFDSSSEHFFFILSFLP
jgi:hypothetical protein